MQALRTISRVSSRAGLARSPVTFSSTVVRSYASAPATSHTAFEYDPSARIKFHGETVEDTGDFILRDSTPGAVGNSDTEPMHLIAQVPPIEVDGRRAACDGGGGPLGHPKVYINLDKPGAHTCGYCGLRFVQRHGHGHHH
eukprot:TRINITY_DN19771_c0_g1_i1.p1 TRINITY_DN19771_c0_g1~~TRINITY_DN19771_c0_g1_i1.p1  ORF type:complete len:141 (-),score=19.42 TRINITY_DN19771_c0_g1_i1:374-796(-)